MYRIQYQTIEGNLALKETHSWDEAMTFWKALLADHKVRIVPNPQTGLDISISVERKPDGMPNSWALMLA